MPEPSEDFADGWMRRFAASAAATEGELSALDQEVGDGDFGANLVAGLEATVRRLDAADAGGSALETAATAFLDEVGGTSGPLFGLLLQEIAAAAGSGGPAAATLATGVGNGLAAIQRVGEAAVGDKTLVDALAPACEALTSYAREPAADPAEALTRAARAAWDGVRDTTRLNARRGRASYVGDRASGVPDPGAVGIGLLFSSARETVTRLAPFLQPAPDGTTADIV